MFVTMSSDGVSSDGKQAEATGSGEWCFDDVDCHPAVVETGGTEYQVVACRHDASGPSFHDFVVRDTDGNLRLIIFDVDGVVVVNKPHFLPNI